MRACRATNCAGSVTRRFGSVGWPGCRFTGGRFFLSTDSVVLVPALPPTAALLGVVVFWAWAVQARASRAVAMRWVCFMVLRVGV